MAASRLMNENTSLFTRADLQIKLHAPASAIPQDLPAPALHDSAPDYRTKPAKRRSRSVKKAKTAYAPDGAHLALGDKPLPYCFTAR